MSGICSKHQDFNDQCIICLNSELTKSKLRIKELENLTEKMDCEHPRINFVLDQCCKEDHRYCEMCQLEDWVNAGNELNDQLRAKIKKLEDRNEDEI